MNCKSKIFVLQLDKSSICFIKFIVNDCEVYVHGCTGAASYIDKRVNKEDGRKIWQEYTQKGWHRCNENLAPKTNWWFWN